MQAQALRLRLDWSETDQLGHINNVAIIKYFQAARVEYLAHIGLPVFPGLKTGPILAATTVQFTGQLHFPGDITVYSRVKETRNTSFTLAHVIYDGAGRLAATADEVLVHFDFTAQHKIPLTPEIRAQMAAYAASFTADLPE